MSKAENITELRKIAEAYELFLRKNPVEREAMEGWESAPLSDTTELKQP